MLEQRVPIIMNLENICVLPLVHTVPGVPSGLNKLIISSFYLEKVLHDITSTSISFNILWFNTSFCHLLRNDIK